MYIYYVFNVINDLGTIMASYGITIYQQCKLTPITEEELIEYAYYALNNMESLTAYAKTGDQPDMSLDWNNSLEQREYVFESHFWTEVKFIWEYAEKGLNIDKLSSININKSKTVRNLHDGYINDLLVDIYKWFATCDATLAHDGSFGYETVEVREAGSKLAYKFIARIKLDFKCNLDDIISIGELYPMTHEKMLTTHEYALLAGLSHVGAVRNEASNKANPLITVKEGNNILIPIDVARKRLISKRKFVQTRGVNDGDTN